MKRRRFSEEQIIGVLHEEWFDLSEVLGQAAEQAGREDERAYASRALAWLRKQGLASPQ